MRLEIDVIDVNGLTPRGVTGLRQAGSRKRYPRGTRGQLVRGTVEVQVAGFFWSEELRTRMVLEAEPVAPNYLGALGDQQGYSLV